MAEIRTINIGKEFIVKFGECETNVPDETIAAVCKDLPIHIEQAIRDKIVESGEISVEPVVFCKNCKHYVHSEVCYCRNKKGLTDIVKPDDFCSYGERKELDNEQN